MTFAPPTISETSWHESHHAASLCLDGLTPLVVRTDWPTATLAGTVRPDWETHDIHEDTMRRLLVATLMGPISEGERVYLHVAWPIDPADWNDACQADARQLAFVCQWLGIDLADYLKFVFAADKRAKDPLFRRLVVEIAGLERDEMVLQPELQALTDEVTR